ncbi:MAG: hypothetical protein V4617_07865 [Gemmatimonadota bacterium]
MEQSLTVLRAYFVMTVVATATSGAQEAPQAALQPALLDTTAAAARLARAAATLIVDGDRTCIAAFINVHVAPVSTAAKQDSALARLYAIVGSVNVNFALNAGLGGGRISVPDPQGGAVPKRDPLPRFPRYGHRTTAIALARVKAP